MPIQMQISEHFICVQSPKLHNLYFVACPWKVPLAYLEINSKQNEEDWKEEKIH